jgi:hypothetical protein
MNNRQLWKSYIEKKNPRRKYGEEKCLVRGEVLDSKHEGKRYRDLMLLQAAGEIYRLERQVEFPCVVEGKKICSWYADFVYTQGRDMVVEDAKSVATRKDKTYRLKKKLVEAFYSIEIQEV